MNELTVTKYNESYIKCTSEDLGLLQELSEFFTFKVPGASFMPSVRAKRWDGQIRLFSKATGKLYYGLLPYVEHFIENKINENNYSINKINQVTENLKKEIKESYELIESNSILKSNEFEKQINDTKKHTNELHDKTNISIDRIKNEFEDGQKSIISEINGYIFIDGLKSYNSGFNKAKELTKKYNWSLTVIDKEDKQNIDQNNMCWIKVNSDV